MRLLLQILLLFLFPMSVIAQNTNSKVLVRNAGSVNGSPTISVKWYSPELYYQEGVNIYRKEGTGLYQKLNNQPVKRLKDLPETEYQKDDDLNFFIPLVNEAKKEDLQGLVLFQVLVKSWESEAFSDFLGIYYNDTTVQTGRTYTYKVTRIKGSTEQLIAESSTITAGPEIIQEPVKEVTIKADTNKAKIKWKPEEQRFFAVNIYRSSDNTEGKKINNRPLVISKYRDSLGNLKYPDIFYTDDSLSEGIYYYQLAGVDFFGKETKRSEAVKIEIKDLVPPPSPEALKDSVRNLDVYLKWSNPEATDVGGINVYRSIKSSGPFVKVNPALLPPLTFEYKDQVEKPGPYYYYVASVDKAGNEGKSRPTFAEVHDIIPPAKPDGLVAKADTGRIHLNWQKNKEGDVTGYLIYRTSNKNDKNNFVLLNADPVKETSFTDKLPASAKNKFLYKVLAIDSSYNKSEYSEPVSVQMPDIVPPVKPLIVSLNNVENSIIVEWIPNKDADLKGYNVYRKTGNENFTQISKDNIASTDTKFADQSISSGVTYYYYLTAVDSAGNESQPSNIQKGYNNYISVTAAPKDIKFKFREDKGGLQINWKQENIGEILAYVIYRREKDTEELRPLSGKAREREFLDKDVEKGKTYYYQIRAYDKLGNIVKSEIKKVTIRK